MPQIIYSQKDERLFLQELAQQFGWDENKTKIFVERMFHDDKTNVEIEEDLSLAGNGVSDFFSDYGYPLLEAIGFGDFFTSRKLKKSWKTAQRFLREEIFPCWMKDRIWTSLWKIALPNGPIELIDETPATPTGIVTAGIGRRASRQRSLMKVKVGAPLRYEVPSEYLEHLILLERDSDGNIGYLSPSMDFPEFEAQDPIGKEEVLAIKEGIAKGEAALKLAVMLPDQMELAVTLGSLASPYEFQGLYEKSSELLVTSLNRQLESI